MTLLFIFIFGLIVGSFLNAVIFRLYSGESFLFGRSHCRRCKKELQAKDLVPLFSFIYLGGRCRYCKANISWQYPAVELSTAIIFVLFALKFQMIFGWVFALFLILTCFLIVIAVFDFNHYLILDKLLLPALILILFYNLHTGWRVFGIGLLSGAGFAGFFLLQYLVSKGKWIGLGDVKLGFVLGTLAGWPLSVLVLLLAYFSGAAAGLILVATGRRQLGSKLPFGVFLSLSAIIVMLGGEPIMAWYLKLLGI